jgi:serine/threonine-protein kinase HipA
MRRAEIFFHGVKAGMLEEDIPNKSYRFSYEDNYRGEPISRGLPLTAKRFEFSTFPPIFDGLLPEGLQLEGLLKIGKIDRDDYFSQLIAVGADLVGAITVRASR